MDDIYLKRSSSMTERSVFSQTTFLFDLFLYYGILIPAVALVVWILTLFGLGPF